MHLAPILPQTDLHLVLVQEYAALGDLYHAVQHVAGADGAAAHHHHAHAPPRLAEGVLGGRVLLPLCRALALLHGRGIVHRDVKVGDRRGRVPGRDVRFGPWGLGAYNRPLKPTCCGLPLSPSAA